MLKKKKNSETKAKILTDKHIFKVFLEVIMRYILNHS